jgi:hypothetical protein
MLARLVFDSSLALHPVRYVPRLDQSSGMNQLAIDHVVNGDTGYVEE